MLYIKVNLFIKKIFLLSILFFSTSILVGEELRTHSKLSNMDVTTDAWLPSIEYPTLYGIGAKVSVGSSTNSIIYFPIQTSPIFQYEPEFQHQKTTDSETINTGNSTFVSQESIFEWMSLGIGFINRNRKKDLSVNSGVRFGLIRAVQYSYSGSVTTDLEGWGYYFSPILAGEYYITPFLSLSGEAQYRFAVLKLRGKTTTASTSGSNSYETTKDETSLSSKFLFTLRWYLPSGLMP